MKRTTKIILFFLALLATNACMPDTKTMLNDIYNVPSSGSSKFDDTKYIRLSNMRCEYVQLELYQDSLKSEKGVVLLKAGTSTITNIDNGKSLWIKLDGETYSFEPIDNMTEYEKNYYSSGGIQGSTPFSNRSYIVPEEFVRKAAESKEFLVRVVQLNKNLVEGQCSPMTLEEAREHAKKMGVPESTITKENLETSNMVTATKGFQKFVEMMDRM